MYGYVSKLKSENTTLNAKAGISYLIEQIFMYMVNDAAGTGTYGWVKCIVDDGEIYYTQPIAAPVASKDRVLNIVFSRPLICDENTAVTVNLDANLTDGYCYIVYRELERNAVLPEIETLPYEMDKIDPFYRGIHSVRC